MGAQYDGLVSRLLAHRGVWDSATPPNSPAALARARDAGFGVETDLRDSGGVLVISHDPPLAGPVPAESTLSGADGPDGRPGMLALNVKADGLAELLEPWSAALPAEHHFFFDMSWPQTLVYARRGLPLALRVSEWEPFRPDLFTRLGIPVRVWLDAFDSDWWVDDPEIRALARHGQVAIVSPELHGRPPERVWDWFGERWQEGGDVYLCTDRCADVLGHLA